MPSKLVISSPSCKTQNRSSTHALQRWDATPAAVVVAEGMVVAADIVAAVVVVVDSLLPMLHHLAGPDGSMIDSVPSKRIVRCGWSNRVCTWRVLPPFFSYGLSDR